MRDPRILFAASLLLVGGALALASSKARPTVSFDAGGDLGGDAPADSGSVLTDLGAQVSGVIDNIISEADTLTTAITNPSAAANVAAFLLTIRMAEGTAGPDGYRTLFGGGKFDSYADHPRQAVTASLNGKSITSTAAGAYQILARTWDDLRSRISLPDFTPDSQDKAAVQLIRQAGALADVNAGRFNDAANKVRGIWASFPGAGYGQPEKTLADLRAAYSNAGGVFA